MFRVIRYLAAPPQFKCLRTYRPRRIRSVGGRKVYDYSFNGFAAELTEAQAQALRGVPGVVAVTKDELRMVDTSSTATFLGLDAPGGLWAALGGVKSAGENVMATG